MERFMNLYEWANRWNIPPAAITELRTMMGQVNTDPPPANGLSEAAIQANIRLDATRKGMRLWRNNVGAVETEDGRFIRYGLCNDSKKMNQTIKSSDLIGIKPVTIEPHHVGTVIGQFVAREVKAGNWRYSGSAREEAQARFIELVVSLGGDAKFANDGSAT
jgi:hypothetical protein